ncbi:hypothetical protein NET03_10125 [Thermomicrobium sp. CFH 73360]|uniref:hypothetical protein n=1 Tax=Thermomicrobium sp. CFH 73360 TaxID=2951987 RepID=UPI00207797A4|nr:hypothetical protein [Thermomicrobium sp. CFH 73360]MCM8746879.1 hypothetical protein [Thermomicrobium sp. CFH 73360]
MLECVWELGVERWRLFCLLRGGRGRLLSPLTPDEAEAVLTWLAEVTEQVPFAMKTTEAPWYRRVAVQRRARLGVSSSPILVRSEAAMGFCSS